MIDSIKIAFLEDHQSIIDGYLFRLRKDSTISIAGAAHNIHELEPILAAQPIDILIMDLHVPVSMVHGPMYNFIDYIPHLQSRFPLMKILVISMLSQRTLVEKLVELGIWGYITKSDSQSIMNLAKILRLIHAGTRYFSKGLIVKQQSSRSPTISLLTPRQIEICSLCAMFPDLTVNELASMLGISINTFRNQLATAAQRLNVSGREAVVAAVRQKGLLQTEMAERFSNKDSHST